MNRVELKKWSKEKVKGNLKKLFPAIFLAGIISNLTYSNTIYENGKLVVSEVNYLGFFFFFIEVGLAYFMINFITDKKYDFNDIFAFSKDFGKDLCVGVLETILVALWSILFIIPGIIKYLAYSLVPILLTDEKYKDLRVTEILKKSEEMMYGHKKDYLILVLSFIGWIILVPFTLGIILFWLLPYMETAATKFLYDVKCDYESQHSEKKNSKKEKERDED